MRRVLLVLAVLLAGLAAGTLTWLVTETDASGESEPSATSSRRGTTTTTTVPAPTTTTLPPLVTPPPNPSGIVNPIEARLPAAPPEGIGPGALGPVVGSIQARLAELRFDPGPVDGDYGPALVYAVEALQKYKGLPATGVVGQAEIDALNRFTYEEPVVADGEPNRTEVDIARQTLTLYENGQPKLLTTMSSGSGESYCYDSPKDNPTERICEIANTPGGRFTYYLHRPGWDVGVLGGLYNPYYFNRGVAVHGYADVPATPASHGCVRIPMHIAEYFPTLVQPGDPVYVVGGTDFEILSRTPLTAAPPPA